MVREDKLAAPQPALTPEREIVQFAVNQISESRQAFERWYKMTWFSIGVVATLVFGALFYFVGQKYEDIESQLQKRAEAKMADIEASIKKEAEQQFQTDSIQALVRDVATQQTKTGLSDVINRAVTAEVSERIKAQEPHIHQVVAQETRAAVQHATLQVNADVRSVVSKSSSAIEKQMASELGRLKSEVDSRISASDSLARANHLANLARNGDGRGYDQLMKLAGETSSRDVVDVAMSVRNQLYLEWDDTLYATRSFNVPPSDEALWKFLDDPQALTRRAAIDTLVGKGEKSAVEKLLVMAEHDPYLVVRRAAFRGLKILTGQDVEPLRIGDWKDWWSKNKMTWPRH